MRKVIDEQLSKAGAILGRVKSKRKTVAARLNAKKPRKKKK